MAKTNTARHVLTKVPEITVFFWIIKILTTGMGETTSDFLVTHFDPIVGVAFAAIGFIAALILQFRVKKYIPFVYWFNVVMIAVFGTMAADLVHVVLGVPYIFSTTFFLIALGIIFAFWYKFERTLSIHSIYTFRREVFYWLTVMATFALGTAAGDMTASTLKLGYFTSGVMFAVLIAVVTAAHYLTRGILAAEHKHQSRNAVLAFWLAYILTRPLGASFADWMGVSPARSGLGWGTGPVSLVLLIIIICLVGYLTVTHSDEERNFS